MVLRSVTYDRLPDGRIVLDLLLADGAGVAFLAVSQLVAITPVDQQTVTVVVGTAVGTVLWVLLK